MTNRSAAACQLVTRDASDIDGFDLAIHGQRFRSASSDIFGALRGQDFIDPARDLVDGTVVISVEPSPDNSPAPFFFKPLVDMTTEDVGPGVLQGMGNNAEATAVFGSATLL